MTSSPWEDLRKLEKMNLELLNHVYITRSDLILKALGFPDVRFENEQELRQFRYWISTFFAGPAPEKIKRGYLVKAGLSGATWIETGTHRGETTELLAKNSKYVFSIEPHQSLYEEASKRLLQFENVRLIRGTSEEVLDGVCREVSGDVNFWLDGHNSGEATYKGPNDTPIVIELETIKRYLPNYEGVRIFIDDLRLFNGRVYSYGPYPDKNYLVDWARQNGLSWSIEMDIFVMQR